MNSPENLILIIVLCIIIIILYVYMETSGSNYNKINLSNNIFKKYKNKNIDIESNNSEYDMESLNIMKEDFFIKKKKQNEKLYSILKKYDKPYDIDKQFKKSLNKKDCDIENIKKKSNLEKYLNSENIQKTLGKKYITKNVEKVNIDKEIDNIGNKYNNTLLDVVYLKSSNIINSDRNTKLTEEEFVSNKLNDMDNNINFLKEKSNF